MEHTKSFDWPGRNIIEIQRLILRPWQLTDAESLFRYASEPRVSESALWPTHTSVMMSREVIEKYFIPNEETYAIVLKVTDEPIGAIGLVPDSETHYPVLPGEKEVGYWIGLPYWNQGFTTEALKALIYYCANILRLNSLLITTLTTNAASQAVARRAGFVPVNDFKIDSSSAKAFRLNLK